MIGVAIIIVGFYFFPRLAAEWYAKFEAVLPEERDKVKSTSHRKKVKARAKRMRKARQRAFDEQHGGPL